MAEKKEVIPAYVRQLFFALGKKLLNNFIIKALTRLGMSVGLKLAGPLGWIASFFVNKILKNGWELLVRAVIHKKEKVETAKELKKYEEIINKPEATPEEIKDAGKDFLSS